MKSIPVRIIHEPRRREVTVVRKENLSPHSCSITLGGVELADFETPSFEDHVKLFVTNEAGEMIGRHYTVRGFERERNELTLEVGLHQGGEGSAWAQKAVPGDQAVLGGPKGSVVIPVEYDWHLLIGDWTAMPAILRRLEELPAEVPVIARILVPETHDIRSVAVKGGVDLQWFVDSAAMVESVREIQVPPGEGFAWCAGEAGLVAEMKGVLVDALSLPIDRMKIGAYWKQGKTDFQSKLIRPKEKVKE